MIVHVILNGTITNINLMWIVYGLVGLTVAFVLLCIAETIYCKLNNFKK